MVQIRNNGKLRQYVLSTVFIGSSILLSSCGKTKITDDSKIVQDNPEELIQYGPSRLPITRKTQPDSDPDSDKDSDKIKSDSEGSGTGSENENEEDENFDGIGMLDAEIHNTHPINLNTSINNQIVPNANLTKKILIRDLEHKIDPKTLNTLKKLINSLKTRDGFKGAWIEKYVGSDNINYVKNLCKSLKIDPTYMGLDPDNAEDRDKRNSLENIVKYLDYACNGIKQNNGTIKHCNNHEEFVHRMENLLTMLYMKEGEDYKYVGDKGIPAELATELANQIKPILKEIKELGLSDSKLRVSNLSKHKHTLRKNIEAIGRPTQADLPESTLCGFMNIKNIQYSSEEDKAVRLIYGLFRRAEELIDKVADDKSSYKEIIENSLDSFVDNYNHTRQVIKRCLREDPNWKTGTELLKQLEFAPSLAAIIKTSGKIHPDLKYLDAE